MDTAYNFLKKFKLYDVCSDDGRENLEYVHFINGYAYASDAHIIVRVPLSVCTSFSEDEYKKLNGYSIHFSLLKMLMQFEVVNIDDGIDLDDKGETFYYIELTATMGENEQRYLCDAGRNSLSGLKVWQKNTLKIAEQYDRCVFNQQEIEDLANRLNGYAHQQRFCTQDVVGPDFKDFEKYGIRPTIRIGSNCAIAFTPIKGDYEY